MSPWIAASGVFFVYVAIVAMIVPHLPSRKRMQAMCGAVAGLAITAAASRTANFILMDWVMPPMALLTAYWASGRLFVRPMPTAERALAAVDRALGIQDVAARTPPWMAEFLELAYAWVYPTIPLALAISMAFVPGADPERFWSVILVTDYICFGMLPWVQTRPPRAIETEPPWQARFRRVNLGLLGSASIQVNTFPSGHAAEALASAFLVVGAPSVLVIWMFFNAAAISAGTVLGRYHYAADVIAGWVVAIVVAMVMR
ncbi:MAG: phosphatase PAP2 family protein [Acidobacteria bacterium]|nr:phosphatase PAP2 family protein [Acidobacteriota bacterium]MCA1650631.1 phosphatase PAP2 family protein [Acidobacteriota bacterium]